MWSRTKYPIIVGLSAAGIVLWTSLGSLSQAPSTKDAERAINQLWDADQKTRDGARDAIVQLGQVAVPALINALQSIVDDPTPRFAPGGEEEAVEWQARYRTLLQTGRTEEARETLEHLMNLTVNWRLKRDICQLLGRLKAEQAIPTLIEVMEAEASVSSSEIVSPPMQALIEIGSPAVPKLIEAIETATIRTPLKHPKDQLTLGEEAQKRTARIEVFQSQARACIVLGAIGDARALAVLQKLLSESQNPVLIPYVSAAIASIQKTT